MCLKHQRDKYWLVVVTSSAQSMYPGLKIRKNKTCERVDYFSIDSALGWLNLFSKLPQCNSTDILKFLLC